MCGEEVIKASFLRAQVFYVARFCWSPLGGNYSGGATLASGISFIREIYQFGIKLCCVCPHAQLSDNFAAMYHPQVFVFCFPNVQHSFDGHQFYLIPPATTPHYRYRQVILTTQTKHVTRADLKRHSAFHILCQREDNYLLQRGLAFSRFSLALKTIVKITSRIVKKIPVEISIRSLRDWMRDSCNKYLNPQRNIQYRFHLSKYWGAY